MPKACATCRWYEPLLPEDTAEDALGTCEWPAERLPYSLRRGNRERVMVSPTDGETCWCYEAEPDEGQKGKS